MRKFSEKLLQQSCRLLVATVWGSALIFGVYILAFYALSYANGDTDTWNTVLPGLYDPKTPVATTGIAVHFVAGGIILILGCLQLMTSIRDRYPKVHRIFGRIYIFASIAVALGGLTFIVRKGTIGGTVMNIGFALYGVLMLWAAVRTVQFGRRRELDKHRAWALRLFALAIGSWLYRMEYGFYFGFGGVSGHTPNFTGWFDYFMDFWFYLPNLVVAEILIGRHACFQKPGVRVGGATAILLASALLLFASFVFVRDYWGPAIVG